VMLGENPYPRLKLHWLVKLQWLLKLQWPAAARDRLRIAEPPRFRRACRCHAAQHSRRQSPSRAARMAAKSRASGAPSRPRSRRSRSREARALTAHHWSGSGLPCDHGRRSCRARAANRYATMGGDGDIDSDHLFLSLKRHWAFCTVPLQCHPKQCADKHLTILDGTERHRRFYLAINPRP
jgi:hypothetical protein